MKRRASLLIAAMWPLLTAGVLDSVGEAVKEGAEAASEGASAVGKAASDTVGDLVTTETIQETRTKIDATARDTLDRLFKEQATARKLYDMAYGYAVFDTRKMSILITTGFGGGVAVEKGSGQRTYMKMATGGVNLGVGGQIFQLVFLFENNASFRNFVDNGWEAGAEANATLGKASLGVAPRFVEGMAVYQLTEAGVVLDINFTGTKYWKDADLNQAS
jgi:lipid-binding SYLF domain-containing protein